MLRCFCVDPQRTEVRVKPDCHRHDTDVQTPETEPRAETKRLRLSDLRARRR